MAVTPTTLTDTKSAGEINLAGILNDTFNDIWPFLVKTMLVLADKIYVHNSKQTATEKPEGKPILTARDAHAAATAATTTAAQVNAAGVVVQPTTTAAVAAGVVIKK